MIEGKVAPLWGDPRLGSHAKVYEEQLSGSKVDPNPFPFSSPVTNGSRSMDEVIYKSNFHLGE